MSAEIIFHNFFKSYFKNSLKRVAPIVFFFSTLLLKLNAMKNSFLKTIKKQSLTSFLAAVIIFSFCLACKSQKNSSSQNGNDKSDSLIITINRYPCFGRCPYFFASIYQSGYATIDRKGFMDDLGLYSTHFSKAQVQTLLDEAKSINYEAMPDSFYNQGLADFPATVTSVKLKGKRKTIFNGVPESPKELKDFEESISNLFMSKGTKWMLLRKKEAD